MPKYVIAYAVVSTDKESDEVLFSDIHGMVFCKDIEEVQELFTHTYMNDWAIFEIVPGSPHLVPRSIVFEPKEGGRPQAIR